jgi:peptidoglycan glycosyltransferase
MSGNIRWLAATLSVLFLIVSLGVGYWQIVRADELSSDGYNPRLYSEAAKRERGQIVDRDGTVLARTESQGGSLRRVYASAIYEPFVGYATLAFGAAGIEKTYASSLIGEDPADPLGAIRHRYLGERTPPGSVRLALSAKLQNAAATALGQRKGAIIALDPRTGEILASVSFPRYDANPLTDSAKQQDAFKALNADEGKPFLDRAVMGMYPPGSTFKLVTGAAAVELGLDPNKKIRVDSPWKGDPSWGSYAVPSPTNAHGDFDLRQAYAFSENIYFAMAAVNLVHGDRLVDYAKRFMVGQPLGLDGPYLKTQLSNSGQLDRPTLVAATGFGQGELLISPLQMALITSAIAQGGVMPTPHYALDVRDGAGKVIRSTQPGPLGIPIRSDTAKLIAADLVYAVEGPGAFAYPAAIPGVHVAGKTGTAENPQGAPHGWFVGFAPAESPTIAIAVVIENAQNGGLEAAAVGGQVLRSWLGK